MKTFLHFKTAMKLLLSCFVLLLVLAPETGWGQTNNYFGTSGTLSGTFWSTAVGGPYTSALNTTGGAIINFGNNTTSITGASITVFSINATADATITTAGGTISNLSGVVPITVAAGKTLDFGTQTMSGSATAGYSKNGAGVFAMAGNTYQGGFTLNAGTFIARGVNAMGTSGGTNSLTINGGILAANSTKDFTGKFPGGIIIGGDFTFGATTGLAATAANLTFSNTIALGAATFRTITIGGTGTYSLGGIISGSGSGLTIANTAAGVLVFSGANTYNGGTTLTGGTLQLGAAGVLADAGSISMNGGTLKTGISTGFSETMGTLALTNNSTIALGTGAHTITFAASNGIGWTSSKILTVNGWTGSAGVSGTAGKIFVGSNASGLTSAQLAQISFTGFASGAMLLATGEIVPAPVATTPTVTTNATPIAVSATSATLGGNVTATGGSAITDNGIVYALTSVNGTPAISGSGVTQIATVAPGAGTGTFSDATGVLLVNTQYSYRAYAINAQGTSYGGVSGSTFYTLANTPGVPVVANPTQTTLDVTLNATTENANPGATEYAIQETGGMYVQANGSLSAIAVWQTAAIWGTKTVTGLSPTITYTFQVKARNGALVETAFGATAAGTTLASLTPALTIAGTLNEATLSGSTISVTLANDTFVDGTLNVSNFVLANAPSGVTIGSVVYNSPTTATITLAYDDTDFDSNVTNLNLTILAVELNSNVDLTSNPLTVSAVIETLAVGTIANFSATQCVNTTSAANSFTITGTNLKSGLVNVNALAGFSYSNTSGGTYTSTLSVSQPGGSFSQTIFVKFSPTLVQSYNGNILISGVGAASVNRSVVGSGVNNAVVVTTGTSSATTSTGSTLAGSLVQGCSAVTGYGIEYSLTNGFVNGSGIQSVGSNLSAGSYSVAIAGLSPNTIYYYKGYGTDGTGTNYGSQLSFATAAIVAPIANAASGIQQDQFTANWSSVSGATSYRLDVSTSPTFGTTVNATDLFISEYLEGTSNNKAIEIYNGTGASVNLSNYTLKKQVNGVGTYGSDLVLSGTIANGSTFVIANSLSNATILGLANLSTSSGVVTFNGNDAVALYKNGVQIDVVGVVNQVANWGIDVTLVRKATVLSPTVNYALTDWNSFATDNSSNLGIHAINNTTSSFVAGYQDLTVNGTSQVVSGLIASTNYYYRVRAFSATSTSTNSNVITVLTAPAAPTFGGIVQVAAVVCDGTSATFNVTGLLPNSTSTISFNINGGATQTVSGVVANGSGFATFNLVLVIANDGQTLTVTSVERTDMATTILTVSSNNTAVLSVNPTPSATAPANQTYCNGAVTSAIALSGTPTGVVYDITGGTSVGLANQTGVTSVPSYTASTGSATISITPTANGCSGSTVTYNVTVNPTPTATAPANQTYCNGTDTTAMAISGSPAGVVYDITGGTSVGLANQTGVTSVPSYTATIGNATVIITPRANGCTGSTVTFNVIVNPTPTAIAPPNQTYCNGDAAAAIAISGSPSGVVYDITGGTSVGLANQTGVTSVPSYTATAGSAIITITPSANGCTGSAVTYSVVVNPTPTATAPANQSYCNGMATAAIALSGTPSGVVYDITGGTSVGLANQTGVTSIPSYTATTGSAIITITPRANGCTGTAVTYNVTVNPIPTTTAPANQTYCNGTTTAAIALSGTPSGVTFNITGGSAVGLADQTGVTSIPSYTATAGSAAISITPTANGCTGSAVTYNVTVSPSAVAGSVGPNNTVCSGSNSGLLTLTGATGTVVRWESSVAPFTTWTTIANTTSTYTSGALTQTTKFRAVVQSGACGPVASAAATITINVTTLTSMTSGPAVCVFTSQTVTLHGLVANSIFTANYTMGTQPGTTPTLTANASGDASFQVIVVAANQNIVINSITRSDVSPSCPKTFTSGNSALLLIDANCSAVTGCGQTLAQIDSYVYSTIVGGAQGYRWNIYTNSLTSTPQTTQTYLRAVKITSLPVYAFDTLYYVEVSVLKNGVWGPYSAPCAVRTPATTTQLTNCGATLTSMTDVIYANIVPFAAGYHFTITNVANPGETYTIDRNTREFRMSLFGNQIQYNSTYSVTVAVINTNGQYIIDGPVCYVTTPTFPTTQVQDSQCGLDVPIDTMTTPIYADAYNGAEGYRFLLTNSNLVPAYSQSVDRLTRTFTLSNFTGLIAGTTYTVKVSIQLNGIWGPYGKACAVTVPGAARVNATYAPISEEIFKAAAYPNPFANDFKLDLTTSSDSQVEVKVYDMTGRLIEVRKMNPSDVTTQQIGDRYPSGVYNVIVSQGANVKTLRVIKR